MVRSRRLKLFAAAWLGYAVVFAALFGLLGLLTGGGGDGPADSPLIELVGRTLGWMILPVAAIAGCLPHQEAPSTLALWVALWALNGCGWAGAAVLVVEAVGRARRAAA